MCPVCKAQAFFSEACSGSVTCNQCPVCYSGALFMPSFVLFHLVFMSCAHLLDGLAVPDGKLALTTLLSLINPLLGVLIMVFWFGASLCLPVCQFQKISDPDFYVTKQSEVKSIDYFDWPSASATRNGILSCGIIFFQGRLPCFPWCCALWQRHRVSDHCCFSDECSLMGDQTPVLSCLHIVRFGVFLMQDFAIKWWLFLSSFFSEQGQQL